MYVYVSMYICPGWRAALVNVYRDEDNLTMFLFSKAVIVDFPLKFITLTVKVSD